MGRRIAKWVVAILAVAVMVWVMIRGGYLSKGPGARDSYQNGAMPIEAYGPPPVTPRSSKGDGNIDVWKEVEE